MWRSVWEQRMMTSTFENCMLLFFCVSILKATFIWWFSNCQMNKKCPNSFLSMLLCSIPFFYVFIILRWLYESQYWFRPQCQQHNLLVRIYPTDAWSALLNEDALKYHPVRDQIKVSSSRCIDWQDNWGLMRRITMLCKFISNYLIRAAALQRYSTAYTLINSLSPCSS